MKPAQTLPSRSLKTLKTFSLATPSIVPYVRKRPFRHSLTPASPVPIHRLPAASSLMA
jgi:hypothetical protein